MNVFDLLLVIASFILLLLLYGVFRNDKKVIFGVIITSFVIMLLQLLFSLPRWQLYLIYFSIPLLAVLLYFKYIISTFRNKIGNRLLTTVITLFVLVSVVAVFSFPIYEIPDPSGEYLIGTKTYVIEDNTREELYSEEDFRKIKIQVWYPAESVDDKDQAPWLEGGYTLSRALAKDNWLPSFALDHAVHVMSNSYYDAPLREDVSEYPIVVISHGWRGFSTLHTDFAEELASIGYIVVSIDHTYGSVATVFGEDDYAYLNLDALPTRETNEEFLEDANQLVYTYGGDIITTLDYLELLNANQESFFYNRMDLDTIGLLGHSTGGGAGVAVALEDDRIDAVFGLDSWVEPVGNDALSAGLDIPSMFIRSGSWETGPNNDYLYTLIESSTYESSLYQIDGTTHYDFAMVYMYSPLTKYIGFTGSVDNDYLTIMLKDLMTSFFDTTLKHAEGSIINSSEYEELVVVNPNE